MAKANIKLEKEVLSLEEKYENATQVNGELKELLLLLKDKYETLLEKNEQLEGQMVALSTSFKSMKEELLLQRIGEQPMLMLAQEPWDADKQEASAGNGNDAAGLGNQLAEAEAVDGSFSSNSGSCRDGKSALWARLLERRDAAVAKCCIRWHAQQPEGAARAADTRRRPGGHRL
ncbi:hypothetical protein BS78_08G155300 [Paspalum vaginatum]|nr:hypothetical protein BS78_08G155300 [Paspalum vaginatum]